jgi:hypothetical protein
MAFIDQVQDLTSLSLTGDTDELTQFLRDGVIEVTNRCIQANEEESSKFGRYSDEQAANGLDLGGAKILSVIRESGTNDDWRNCREVGIELQSRVTDGNSLHYASKSNPAYTITADGEISVFPIAAGGGADSYKVYYINNVPENEDSAALLHSHTNIKYFPLDKVYLVIMYAGMRALTAKMGESVVSLTQTVPSEPIMPQIPSVPGLSAAIDVVVSGLVAPTYIKPSMSLTAFPSLNWDMPAVPLLPSINAETSSSGGASVDLTKLATAPTFTPPIMNAPDFSDANTWINTEEDSEMLASRVSVIQAQIGEYQAKINESTQEFNEKNTEYQAKLQIALQDAQLANTGDGTKISKASQEISKYGAEVNKVIQQNQGKIAEWNQENQTNLSKFNADIQAEIQKFNAENAKYQGDLQIVIQNARQANAEDADKLTKYSAEVSSYSAEVGSTTQKYQAELSAYSAETGKEIQEQNLRMQHYMGLYNQIKTEYDRAYGIMAPQRQGEQ